jgi:hypothetical protein
MSLQEFMKPFNQKKEKAKEQGLCVICGKPALDNCYSEAGVREYQISGTCEKCFDEMFQEEDDDEEAPAF